MRRYIALSILILALVIGAIFTFRPKPKTNSVEIKNNGTYYALGDSIAAGDGLSNYSDTSACNRSNLSYPVVTSKKLHLKAISLACSGASYSLGINGPQDVNKLTISAQIDKLSTNPKPRLITLTAGANDISWIKVISSCYLGPCGNPIQTSQLNNQMSDVSTGLNIALQKIQSIYMTSPPTVIVTGYYSPFSQTFSKCSDTTNLDQTKTDWLSSETDILNNKISSIVSNYSFAKYVTLDFNGHGLCSANTWIQGLTERAPYHPNELGQEHIAGVVSK